MFKYNKVLLDSEVLELQEEKEEQRVSKEKKNKKKYMAMQHKKCRDCHNVLGLKFSPSLLTNNQLKAVISFVKRKGDAAMPNKKEFLVKQYQE